MSESGHGGGSGPGAEGGADHGAADVALPERLQQRATSSLGQVDVLSAQRTSAARAGWAASRFGVAIGLVARTHAAGESPGGPAQEHATDPVTALMSPAGVRRAPRIADGDTPPGSIAPGAAETTAAAPASLLARQIRRATRPGIIDRALAIGLHDRGSFGVRRAHGGPMAALMRRAAAVVQDGESPEDGSLRLARRMDPESGADAPLAQREADAAGTPAVREQTPPGTTAPDAAKTAAVAPAAGGAEIQSLAPLLARRSGRVMRPGSVDRSPGLGVDDGGTLGVSRRDAGPADAGLRRAAPGQQPPEPGSRRVERGVDASAGPELPLARGPGQPEARARDGGDLPSGRAARTDAPAGRAPSPSPARAMIQRAPASVARPPIAAREVPGAPPAGGAVSSSTPVSQMIQRAPAAAARRPAPAREIAAASMPDPPARTSGQADLPLTSRARRAHAAVPSAPALVSARASADPVIAPAVSPRISAWTGEPDRSPVAPSVELSPGARPLLARKGDGPEIASAAGGVATSLGSAPPRIQRSAKHPGSVAGGDREAGASPVARASEIAPASSAGSLPHMVWRRAVSGAGAWSAAVGATSGGGTSAAAPPRPGDGSVPALLRAPTGAVQRQADPSSGDATPAAPATPASAGSFAPDATASPATRSPLPSVQEIADQVARIIGRQLEVENERRGVKRWA